MRRLLDLLQVLFYTVAISVLLACGAYALTLMHELSTALKQERLQHEQQRRDHTSLLKDHDTQRQVLQQTLADHQRLLAR